MSAPPAATTHKSVLGVLPIDYALPFPNLNGIPLWLIHPSPSPNAVEAITKLHERGRATSSLIEYTQAADILAPGQRPSIHHKVICDAIDGLLDDEYDDLIINTPPGSAKSTYTSHALGSYFLGKRPRDNIILAMHTADIAERFSGKVRDTYASEAHQRLFPDATLSSSTSARARWATTLGGEFLATGAGASILGFRADLCLTENAQVCTKIGYTSISNIKSGDEVLAYDTKKLSTGYHRVVAVAERNADHIYRIHAADGRVVEATGNHPFYSGGQFVPAMALVVGDSLLSAVWDSQDNPCCGNDEIAFPFKIRDGLLQQKLCERLHSTASNPELCRVRRAVSSSQEDNSLLLPRLFGFAQTLAQQVVRSMRRVIQTAQSQVSVLLHALQKHPPFATDACQGQSELAGRERPEPLPAGKRPSVSGSTEDGHVSGQSTVRGLRQHGESSWSSCGRERAEQQLDQHSDAVPVVSHDIARRGTRETTETNVARIEVVRGNTRVFDIQVEGVSNFFANGILVHNCLIDDPVGGFEQAQSETQLAKLHNWFETDLMTRLKPGGKIVLICQRLSPNDLAGYMMQRHAENPSRRLKIVTLRMEYEEGDEDGTGRSPGDRLWPEWFTQEMVDDRRRDEYRWQTLYQQRPPSAMGDWVSADCISIVDRQEVPELDTLSRYVCIDLALSINKGDYTVFITPGVDSRGDITILDAWRTRAAVDNTADKLLDLVEHHKPQECLIDDDNAAKVYMQLLADRGRARSVVPPMKMLPMRGQDKETRAAPLRALFRSKRIRFVRAPWNEWLLREIVMFPNATGAGVDDGVDALGLIGRRLSRLSRPAGAPPPAPPPLTLRDMNLEGLYDERARAQSLGRRRF